MVINMSQDDIINILREGEKDIYEIAEALDVTPNTIEHSICRIIKWDEKTNQTTLLKRKHMGKYHYRYKYRLA